MRNSELKSESELYSNILSYVFTLFFNGNIVVRKFCAFFYAAVPDALLLLSVLNVGANKLLSVMYKLKYLLKKKNSFGFITLQEACCYRIQIY